MSKKILIVEDEDEYRSLLEKILGEAGFSVSAASNGKTGIALYASEKPDLVLLDVMLPDMIGFDIARSMLATGRSQTPILFCSVRSAATSLADGLRAGSVDYVLKPFDPDDLLKRVRAALRVTSPELRVL